MVRLRARKRYSTHREELKENARKWQAANPERRRELQKRWQAENADRWKARQKAWREKNPEKAEKRKDKRREASRRWRLERMKNPAYRKKLNSRRELYRKRKMENDPEYRIKCQLRKRVRDRIRDALKGRRKSESTFKMVGCSPDDFKRHIELQFERGMTWENGGIFWHLDHVFPCARFDLTKPEEQKRCFHWTNFQPLYAKENLIKSDKITRPQMSLLLST